jgi:hypothetical protein
MDPHAPPPFHLHGADRFLMLARDVVAEPNLVSRVIVLVRAGQTAHILFDATSPGVWMSHCHIAKHMQSGMMLSFNVARDLGRRRLRPGRGDERLRRRAAGHGPRSATLARYSGRWSCASASRAVAVSDARRTRFASSCAVKSPSRRSETWMNP